MFNAMGNTLKLGEDLELELLDLRHRDELFLLVDHNRPYLREWMGWLDVSRTPDDTSRFLQAVIEKYKSGEGPQYGVLYRSFMCGVCGFNRIDKVNKIGSIGYWLGEAYSGKGVMTQAVAALLAIGFGQYKLNKIEIYCATENTKSRAVPERLGFHFDGVLRQNEHLYGKYVDHAVYSMLATEYLNNKGKQ